MTVCIISGKGHNFQAHDDPWMFETLQKSTKLIFVVVEDSCSSPPDLKFDKDIAEKFLMLTVRSSVEAIFKLKESLDQNQILEAKILVPEENLGECDAFVKLLFPEIFKVSVDPFPVPEKVKPWTQMVLNNTGDEALLKQFLTTVPSQDNVKTVQSNMIPGDMFIHGYATRYGGISTWPTMASLNLVYSLRKPDSIFVVKENARRLCAHLDRDPEKYHVARANHGNKIWVYEKSPPEAYDGIITQTPGVFVASPAADCNMLLLADPVTKSCGAIHAGWKGILFGIVEASVKAMVSEYKCDPKNIIASLGPSLSVCCCEFGVEDSKKFLSIDKNIVVWKEEKEKPYIDLRLGTRILLERSGIKAENIDEGVHGSNPTPELAVCTKCDPNKDFFSYRRDGPKFGNQVAFISLR